MKNLVTVLWLLAIAAYFLGLAIVVFTCVLFVLRAIF